MGVYSWIVRLRNHAFNMQWARFKTKTFPNVQSICVGNLSMGGTGKTPMVAYLAEHFLAEGKKVVIMSLGYKRKKKGNFFATLADNALSIGDEPAQYVQDFNAQLGKTLFVYLCKRRDEGVENVLKELPDVNTILFDDGYQHRYVKAGVTLLLSTYYKPYFMDRVLPYGSLREPPEGSKRADVILITKCPPQMNQQERFKLEVECGLLAQQKLFCAAIGYNKLIDPNLGEKPDSFWEYCGKTVVLVTGIAYPQSLIDYLSSLGVEVVKHFKFADHHNFTIKEVKEVEAYYKQLCSERALSGGNAPCLLTTQKDYMRLCVHKERFPELPWHYMSIRPYILFNEEQEFLKTIKRN